MIVSTVMVSSRNHILPWRNAQDDAIGLFKDKGACSLCARFWNSPEQSRRPACNVPEHLNGGRHYPWSATCAVSLFLVCDVRLNFEDNEGGAPVSSSMYPLSSSALSSIMSAALSRILRITCGFVFRHVLKASAADSMAVVMSLAEAP